MASAGVVNISTPIRPQAGQLFHADLQFIPYLGMVLCALALVGIIAAVWRVESWKRKAVYGDYGGEGEHDTFSMVQPKQPAIVIMGYCSSVGIPLVLAAAWVFIRLSAPAVA